MLYQCFRGAGAIGRGFCDVIRQGIIFQCRLIAVQVSSDRRFGILNTVGRVHNGELRTLVHIKVLIGLADRQGMPVQIDGSVVRNAQIRATAVVRRPGIAGQLKVAALGELIPDIAGQILEGQKP